MRVLINKIETSAMDKLSQKESRIAAAWALFVAVGDLVTLILMASR